MSDGSHSWGSFFCGREGEGLGLHLTALGVLDLQLDEGNVVFIPLRERARLECEGHEERIVRIHDADELAHVVHLGEERLQRALRGDLVLDRRADLHRLLEVGHVDVGLLLQPIDFVTVLLHVLVCPFLHGFALLLREARGQEFLHGARRLLHEHLLGLGVGHAPMSIFTVTRPASIAVDIMFSEVK